MGSCKDFGYGYHHYKSVVLSTSRELSID